MQTLRKFKDGQVQKYKLYIGGKWVDSASKETLDVINLANRQVIAKVPKGTKMDVDRSRKSCSQGSD